MALSLVTLGVADLARSRRFYEAAFGWKPSSAGNEHVTFYDTGTIVLALWGRAALAEDAHVAEDGTGFAGFSLACNLTSREEVDAAYARAVDAGARPLKPPREVFWGGYSGYVADPDGFAWELAHNPFWPLDHGRIQLPEPLT